MGYNESNLILNSVTDSAVCRGVLDRSGTAPVVRFSFPLRQDSACGSNFRTTNAAGTGMFSDFSNIQWVNISGLAQTFDPTVGMVTYNAELKYMYSCAYPLEYLTNNTHVDVSSSSVAVKDINGSFISTLSMQLFRDVNCTSPLIIPPLGIELRTNIYVQVIAADLTSQYFVLLDRCYASISAQPANSTFFNLFVSCSIDQMTSVMENGISQKARFSFPAFRFTEQQNQTISTYYLHCITRLCERTTCSQFKQCQGGRRRRSAETMIQDGLSAPALITSAPITIRTESPFSSKEQAISGGQEKGQNMTSVGLGIIVAILTLIGVVSVLLAVSYRKKLMQMT
ncbi:zona pellucida-like domain-containing protein 1 isoform X2 [Denticeps clupeoides]|nr:zona pellucida-like domain-containing protein 1 isoform X2 [Denticeps clupeoides]